MNIKFLQNNEGDDWDIGDTIRIEATVKESEPFEAAENADLVDPSTIEITITGYQDNEVVSNASMTQNSTGQYFYNWDTSGLDPGDYEIEITASQNGTAETDDEWIRLTD